MFGFCCILLLATLLILLTLEVGIAVVCETGICFGSGDFLLVGIGRGTLLPWVVDEGFATLAPMELINAPALLYAAAALNLCTVQVVMKEEDLLKQIKLCQ